MRPNGSSGRCCPRRGPGPACGRRSIACPKSPGPRSGGGAGGREMPDSGWNDIPEDALRACGYRVLMRSEDAGVDTFVKQRQSLFVFLQGHPEYEAVTLLLEYRRDVARYLRSERDTYPPMPQG